MMRARRQDTGAEVEVLDLASPGMAFVAPPGAGGLGGYLLATDLLDPDPGLLAVLGQFMTPWTPRLEPAEA